MIEESDLGLVNEIENEELPRSNLMTLIWINQAYNMGTKLSPNRFKGVVNRVVEKLIKRENWGISCEKSIFCCY